MRNSNSTSLIRLESLFINNECDQSGSKIPTLRNSQIELLPYFHNHGYNYMVFCLGKIFFTAQRLQSQNILDDAYKVSIVFPKIKKFKDEDSETNFQRWEFICNNFLPPEKGISISFYDRNDDRKNRLLDFHGGFYIWPYKDEWQWKEKNKQDYVVLQNVEEATAHDKNKYDNQLIYQQERIIKELDRCKIRYELVDYKTPIEKLFKLLLNCKMLITYYGCSYYIAAGMNVPTLSFGSTSWSAIKHTNKFNFGGFEYTKKDFFETNWGNLFVKPWNVFHYDKEVGIHQKAQNYITNIGKVENEEEYKILRDKLEVN